MKLFFFLFLFSGYFCFVDTYVVCIVSGRCKQSSIALFLCSLWVIVSMLSSTQANFLPPSFLDTYSLCLRHLWDVKPYASLRVFLFSRSFNFFSREFSRVSYKGDSPDCLSLWWLWLTVVSSWDALFKFFFSFISTCLMFSASNICRFPFLGAIWVFLESIARLISSCVVSRFPLLA